jgi:hypothetical protein
MVQHSNDVLHHVWLFDQSIGLKYVGPSSSMDIFNISYMQYKRCTIIGVLSWVFIIDWLSAVQDVKIQCIGATWGLIEKLQQCFPSQEIINAIGITNL